MSKSSRSQYLALSLVELLTVVAVVGVLVSVMLPSLAASRMQARRIVCLSNLRQIDVATQMYLNNNNDMYPVAQWSEQRDGIIYHYAWDFTTLKQPGLGGHVLDVVAGLVWQDKMVSQIQQCPVFKGAANWFEDPHTGYNYNTSYIGHGQGESVPEPASRVHVRNPAATAIFGDGEYSGGANKFMRAPWPNPGDQSYFGRYAGTQGFRHGGSTNVAFCDGHARAWHKRYTQTSPIDQSLIAEGTGFLSADNRAYELDRTDTDL